MIRNRPVVTDNTLCYQEQGHEQTVQVGTPAWYAWLSEATAFSFESSDGKFTARKERVQRGGEYWKAYRRSRGKLLHSYLGKSEDLTFTRLTEVARLLAWRVESPEGVLVDFVGRAFLARQAIFEDKAGHAVVGEPFADIVAFVLDRQIGMAAARADDDGGGWVAF